MLKHLGKQDYPFCRLGASPMFMSNITCHISYSTKFITNYKFLSREE